ncbi:F0F1 ATP synthase subunit epsilon [Mycoplasmopsis phocirhinis]|uniref:ATP synthase epsilon chain n=1 Tax=Mycoplasmopsis phocirhinis TaxID=142650 RepID=A0A4P6MNK7_9BACT|nr:F0F1 ATP synthase subunit epsilon [Mycoplasmopsis phocirhinis]QBF34470.1 F0F1 ATP synthase subunit epsilon [Mycoplasmopsis phocirhinis]
MHNNKTNTLYLQISTLDGIFFENEINSVSLPTVWGGSIVFQPNHSPFIANIALGQLKINQINEQNPKICAISGGLVYVIDNTIKIITDDIVFRENINVDELKQERDKIVELLKINDQKNNDLDLQLRNINNKINIYTKFLN